MYTKKVLKFSQNAASGVVNINEMCHQKKKDARRGVTYNARGKNGIKSVHAEHSKVR